MSVPYNTPAVLSFEGTYISGYPGASTVSFPITFPTFEISNIEACVVDEDGDVVDLLLGIDFTLDDIDIANTDGQLTLIDAGQAYQYMGRLRIDYTLYIKFDSTAFQPARFRDLGRFAPENIEKSMDRVTMAVLAINARLDRAVTLPIGEEGIVLPRLLGNENKVLRVNAGATGIEYAVLTSSGGSYEGYSARFGEYFGPELTLDETLLQVLNFSYLGPQISLSCSPSTGVREKGSTVASVVMSATTTKRSSPITAVRHYRNGVLVHTEAAANPNGQVEDYTDNTAFSDTMTFYSQVDDGTSVVQSNTITYSYVYPYYYGTGATGKTPAQVAALTKSIIASTSNINVGFTTSNGDVYYFAYPASYGALTSILDANGFETFSDWTLTTANITGLDALAVSYRIYSFNNPVIAGSTSYTFKR